MRFLSLGIQTLTPGSSSPESYPARPMYKDFRPAASPYVVRKVLRVGRGTAEHDLGRSGFRATRGGLLRDVAVLNSIRESDEEK